MDQGSRLTYVNEKEPRAVERFVLKERMAICFISVVEEEMKANPDVNDLVILEAESLFLRLQ